MMLEAARPASPTSPEVEPKAWNCLFFCRYPGCNKGYASTDGVRKHCRKHHAEWLAKLDNTMRENNQKHSAANYCSTQPSDPQPDPSNPCSTQLRKRLRADSGCSSVNGTPNGTPRLDPSVPRRPVEPTSFSLVEDRKPQQYHPSTHAQPQVQFQQRVPIAEASHFPLKHTTSGDVHRNEVLHHDRPKVPVRGISREEAFSHGWPQFAEDDSFRAPEAQDRPLLSALAALDERASAWPHRGVRERNEPLSENFFSLQSGMPVPKRGCSLLSDAMAELARHAEEYDKVEEFADLNSFLRDDLFCPSSPEPAESAGFLADVWA